MLRSVLYAVRDVTVPANEDKYRIAAVHVCTHALSDRGEQTITRLATEYLATPQSTLYIVHVFLNEQKLDFSFGDSGDDESEQLRRTIEQQGVVPFLKSVAASFAANRDGDTVTCNCLGIRFNSLADVDEGVHEAAVAQNVPIDLKDNKPLALFLQMCDNQ